MATFHKREREDLELVEKAVGKLKCDLPSHEVKVTTNSDGTILIHIGKITRKSHTVPSYMLTDGD